MQQFDNPSFFPKQLQFLSGSALKLLAVILMTVDHSAAILLRLYQPAQQAIFTIGKTGYSPYRLCRAFGRLAFPLFCFLIVEGFFHTRSRARYALTMFLFALISELPWNIGLGGSLHYSKQNVFFTLLLGILAMWAAERLMDRPLLRVLSLFAILFVSVLLKADYSYRGYIFILILYFLRRDRAGQALLGCTWLRYEWAAGFAFLFINMYNGKRGFIKGKAAKYFFYAFYPLHITVLVILRSLLFHKPLIP